MKLQKGQQQIVMPEMEDIISIIIKDHNGLLTPLMRLRAKEWDEMVKKPMEGRPVYYYLDQDGRRAYIHPRPDRDYPEVLVDFLPPRQRI